MRESFAIKRNYISRFKPEYSDKGYLAGMSSDEGEDGYHFIVADAETNHLLSMKELSRGPSCMILTKNGFYYPAKGSGMTCLGTEIDENIETWYEDTSEEYLYHTAYVDQLMLTVQADILGKEGAVRCFDLNEKKLNWSFDFYKELGEDARYVDYLGVSQAKDAVWYWIHGSTYESLSAVVKLDLLSGESKVYDLTGLVTDVSFVNDKIFMVKNNGNVSVFDLKDWEMLPYAEAAEKGFAAVSFGPVQSVFKNAQGELFLYNPEDESFADLDLQWKDNTKILMGEDTFFIADEGTHGGVTLQSVRRYSLDELKERAQNLLGEFELSKSQKKEFGLE